MNITLFTYLQKQQDNVVPTFKKPETKKPPALTQAGFKKSQSTAYGRYNQALPAPISHGAVRSHGQEFGSKGPLGWSTSKGYGHVPSIPEHVPTNVASRPQARFRENNGVPVGITGAAQVHSGTPRTFDVHGDPSTGMRDVLTHVQQNPEARPALQQFMGRKPSFHDQVGQQTDPRDMSPLQRVLVGR